MLIIAILASAYCFIAGRSFEFFCKYEPTLSTTKMLLLSLAWPGNAVLFLLMRCVR
ncbi:Uncharacterised protein [Serratia marcescens]|nr:Uncharacterised protein [Serratia marcescens]CUZ35030.1 Uncharacterised protein [Serratia marcescens]CUZ35510.1 Uncharacterised protein [Serratia marcescens]CUZ35685.1 Uncharacterised protein [Serratia marcescens]CVA43621.1 Uncharacterised protein [Serratia marcescens]